MVNINFKNTEEAINYGKKIKGNEEQILHLETIEHLENEVCKGNISNEQFFNNMDNLKEVFKD